MRKVAVLGGDGNKYINQAKFKGADVYVTGDMYYHVAHDAMMLGLNIVDPGHNVEKVMKQGVQKQLQEKSRCKETECTYSCSAITYRSIYICIRKIKNRCSYRQRFLLLFFFHFLHEVIFL